MADKGLSLLELAETIPDEEAARNGSRKSCGQTGTGTAPGARKPVGFHTLCSHVIEHGWEGPNGGIAGADIDLTCHRLAKHGTAVKGWTVTTPKPAFYS